MSEALVHPTVRHLLSLPQPAQRTPEWFAARYKRLTASDVATALGDNPYQSPDTLILQKCGHGEKFEGNEATRHGQFWEEHVQKLFCERHGWDHYDGGLLLHPSIDFLGGSPDGMMSRPDGSACALLEIKCPLRRQIKPGEIPKHYYPQVQLCMEICDVDLLFYVEFQPETLISDEVFSVMEIARDREWFAEKLPLLEAFWKQVLHCREFGVGPVLERIEAAKRPKRVRVPKVVVSIDEPEEEACLIVIPEEREQRVPRREEVPPCLIVLPLC
jgi:putative phage-type endonuclease